MSASAVTPSPAQPRLATRGIVRDFLSCYVAGLSASLAFGRAWNIFANAHVARQKVLSCVVLNLFIFLGSLAVVDKLVLPVISRLLVDERPGFEALAHGLNTLLNILCRVLWLYPCFAMSFFISTFWFQDIAEDAYKVLQNTRPASSAWSWERIIRTVTETVCRLLVVLVFLVESTVVYFVPLVGPPLSFVLTAWLYSFYAFEYKWSAQGWPVQRRVDYFERRWAYFIGFGTVCTAATFFASVLISSGLYATLFPLFIVLALDARPEAGEAPPGSRLPARLPIFGLAMAFVDRFLRHLPALLSFLPRLSFFFCL